MTAAPTIRHEPDDVIGARVMAGLVCECGSTDIFSVAPGSEHVAFANFTVSRGVPARGLCRRCWFKNYGPAEPTIMDWLAAVQPTGSHA